MPSQAYETRGGRWGARGCPGRRGRKWSGKNGARSWVARKVGGMREEGRFGPMFVRQTKPRVETALHAMLSRLARALLRGSCGIDGGLDWTLSEKSISKSGHQVGQPRVNTIGSLAGDRVQDLNFQLLGDHVSTAPLFLNDWGAKGKMVGAGKVASVD